MRKEWRKWDWVALMIDVNPDDLKTCTCDFPALFYVHPKDYRPGQRRARQRWFHIPGKHKNKDAAWDGSSGHDDQLKRSTEQPPIQGKPRRVMRNSGAVPGPWGFT